jgi:hypothetical protein
VAVVTASTEYVRTMSDDKLDAFAEEMNRRIGALLSQGVPLPISEINDHYIIGLLEIFLGEAESSRVREWHLLWTEEQIDTVETELRMRMIGMLDGQT